MAVKSCSAPGEELLGRCHYRSPDAVRVLGGMLHSCLRRLGCFDGRPLAVVCVGSAACPGDDLGPKVGSILLGLGSLPFALYGTAGDPVHAVNLEEKLIELERKYPGAAVVAVDACLGWPRDVGTITVGPGPLVPGRGTGKKLPALGDVSITGTVGAYVHDAFFSLLVTDPILVKDLAECIAKIICFGVGFGRVVSECEMAASS